MGNIIPSQARTIDPYSSYNSNIVNQLTRMVTGGEDCIFGVQSMGVSIDIITPLTCLLLSTGLCFKDDVIIEITSDFTIDMHDSDFYLTTDHFDETGYYYITLNYTYIKSNPAPQAKITIFRPSERATFGSGYLLLKVVKVVGVAPNLSIDSVYDYDPENPSVKRTYTQTYITVEDTLPTFDQARDESRLIYVRSHDEVYFGSSSTWLSWNSVRDSIDTQGCDVGRLVYLKPDLTTGYAICTTKSTFAIGVVIQEGLAITGSGKIKLFGRVDSVPVEPGITLSPGDRLFLSNSDAGSVTNVAPQYYEQFVGTCISFDGVAVTCSMWFMAGNTSSYAAAVESKNSGYSLLVEDDGKCFTCDSVLTRTFILPASVDLPELGVEYSFVQLGPGGIIIEAGDIFQTIQDGSAGGDISTSVLNGRASITLKLVSTGLWIIKTANGVWETT
jgi:hypothetical protein